MNLVAFEEVYVSPRENDTETKQVKVVVLGDSGAGKTSMLISFCTNAFPGEYIPTVFDNYTAAFQYNERHYELGLWDTAGAEDYDRLRPLSYPATDVFLVCFSLANRSTFDSITTKWIPEIQFHVPGAFFILVGTKKDLPRMVTPQEIKALCRQIKPNRYVEVSGLTQENLHYLFHHLIPSVVSDDSIHAQHVKDAIQNSDEVPWRRCKLMVIGQGRAGKTSLVRSLLGQPFVEDLLSTVTASLKQINTDVGGSGWDEIFSKIDFTTDLAVRAGVKRYNNQQKGPVTQNTHRRKTIASSLSSLFSRASKPRDNRSGREPEVQNSNEKPIFDEMEAARVFNQKLFLDISQSLKDGTDPLSLTIWDYGGQTVFYTLHHLFLTRYGIYILVFNLKEALENEDNCVDYLRFWLSSVKLHAPSAPVIAVGTFSAEIESKNEMKLIDEIFSRRLNVENCHPQLCKNEKDNLHFIPVDNRVGDNISVVREQIETLAQQQAFVHQNVSLRWTAALDELIGFQEEDKSNGWLELSQARKIAANYKAAKDLDIMLDFFHELGVIVHLNATEALRNVIVTKPQWLLEKLGKVIWDLDIHEGYCNKAEIKKAGLEQDLNEFLDKGIISRDLLEHLWSGEQVEFLLDMMRRTLLLSDWDFSHQSVSSEVRYLIPSMVSTRGLQDILPGPKCTIDFTGSSLPEGVFQRLVCLCVAHSSRQIGTVEPKLCKFLAQVPFSIDTLVSLEKKGQQIELKVSESIVEKHNHSAAKSLSIVLSMLRKLNEDVMHGGLKWEILFDDGLTYEKARRAKLHPWFAAGDDAVKKVDHSPAANVDLSAFLDAL